MSRIAHLALRVLAVLFAVLMVTLAVARRDVDAARAVAAVVTAVPSPQIATLPAIFPPVTMPAGEPPAGAAAFTAAPELVGIAGRLPDDAEALVRTPEGGTVTLRIGDSADGWTLILVAADRAEFDRDGVRRQSIISPGP